MEHRSSACPLDCPDLCGLDVTVDNGRVIRVDGDRRGPLTNGFICGKVRKIADRLYGRDRLLYPMVRAGAKGSGQWRRVSWDDALAPIASRRSKRAAVGTRSCRSTTAARTAGSPKARSRRASFAGSARRSSIRRTAHRRRPQPRAACTARCPASRSKTTSTRS
jgi:anaerobic selenocysteine-containing dehydrogenase